MTATILQQPGVVGIDAPNGRLRIRLPRSLHQGQQKHISLRMSDTPSNRLRAELIMKLIQEDVALGQFDYSLSRYGLRPPRVRYLVTHIWEAYSSYKRGMIQPTTWSKYQGFTRLFEQLDGIPVSDPLRVKARLEEITTPQQTRAAISQLSSACKWAARHGMVDRDYFKGMAREMPKPLYQLSPSPTAFTEDERDQLLDVLWGHPSRSHFAPFVHFLFYVGCRPSEAIGLRRRHFSENFSEVTFEGALVQPSESSEPVWCDRTKTGKIRTIPVCVQVQNLLQDFHSKTASNELLFQARQGNAIRYRDFARNVWKPSANLVREGTAPYSCRDTFITLQLLRGTPVATVAHWCGTSITTIQNHYFDALLLRNCRPEF
ncbi:MAG: tyrosine-type recombinase/integrase [Cyanobacteria bacterium P01_H01_bin.121]